MILGSTFTSYPAPSRQTRPALDDRRKKQTTRCNVGPVKGELPRAAIVVPHLRIEPSLDVLVRGGSYTGHEQRACHGMNLQENPKFHKMCGQSHAEPCSSRDQDQKVDIGFGERPIISEDVRHREPSAHYGTAKAAKVSATRPTTLPAAVSC